MSYSQTSDFRKVCPQCNKTFQDQDALEILTECPDDGTTLVFDTIDPIVGTRLADRYQIEALIGRGSTSTVYHAVDLKAEQGQNGNTSAHARHVAVKVLHPHLSSDAAVVKRLSQEAKSLRDFSHKNVVNLHTLGVTRQGQPFLVMELVEGQNLLDYLRQNGALSNQLCLAIFDQILDAIGTAHNRGILHRDLKPGNIMLTPDGNGGFHVKLLDFGIAKIVPLQGDTFFRLTQTGEMMGSLLYMSPEQCLEQDWDQRGDIYSLGCVLYEALTARAPLIGRTAFETMNKHLTEMPPPLSVVRPDIEFPRGIEDVVMKMLAKDPQVRFQTAEEVRAKLRLVAEGKGASLETSANRKSKLSGFKIRALSKKQDSSADSGTAIALDSNERGDMLAAKMKDGSRQRMIEVGIFLVLMVIWAIPLLFAFSSTPNALIAACLFGLLLPVLAAISAIVVVRLSRISGVSKLTPLLAFNSKSINTRFLPRLGEPGSLNLGVEANFLTKGIFLGKVARQTVETYQRTQTMPFLVLGKKTFGKTRLLASLVTGDLEDGRKQLLVLSPDGQLADLVVRWIASHPQGKAIARRVLFLDLSVTQPNALPIKEDGNSALNYISEHMPSFMDGDFANGKEGSMREQAIGLIKECTSKRKALIVKGSGTPESALFFRMVLNEILKESRPSLRLSDAENNPVVYIDDAETCDVFHKLAHAFVAPSETGVEFIVSTNLLSNLSDDVHNMMNRFAGLAIFAVHERDARGLEPIYEAQLSRKKTIGNLVSVESDPTFDGEDVHFKMPPDVVAKSLANQPQRSFYYLSKTLSGKPVRLLAPFFPEIRVTEVEWSIVESMRTGWKFNL